jgi:NAD(P)-dependent dehydrogenase (short-subunit alcohol dehydrogenase family)
MLYPDLQDKVVLITGGGGGIGAAAGKAFLENGAKVALVGRTQKNLDAAVEPLGGVSDRLITICADTSLEEDTRRYVDETIAKFGRIDVFFNNAGIEGKVAPIVDQKVEDFDKVIAINVRGTWLGLHFVLPSMYAQKSGSIINTSSIGGLVSGPMPVSPYVTSKFAITGMTRIAAMESAPYNVRVNSIHPSPVETKMMRALEAGANPDDPEGVAKSVAASIPLGRYAESGDIASLVLFLASEQSSFITGSNYRIDGGMLS